MLKIYSVGDKQDAAALEPWRRLETDECFTDVLWERAKSTVLTLSQQLPLKTQTKPDRRQVSIQEKNKQE